MSGNQTFRCLSHAKLWNKDVKFIQIDIDPEKIENARKIAVPVVGDIRSAMTMLNGSLAEFPFKASEERLGMLKEAGAKNVAKFAAKENSDQVPMGTTMRLAPSRRSTTVTMRISSSPMREPTRWMTAATSSICTSHVIVWTAARGA